MTTEKALCLNDACHSIGLVLLLVVGAIVAGEIVALRTFPSTEATAINMPLSSTSDEVASAAEAANSPYAQGYGQTDYMASPALDAGDRLNWFFGEGEATHAGLVP